MTPKFYFFDCGIPHALLGRTLTPRTPEFGKSFEQFMILEAIAAIAYSAKIQRLSYWRSASGFEVDLIVDDHTAIEFKTGRASIQDAQGLLALAEEVALKHLYIVNLEAHPRQLGQNVSVLPWKDYLQSLKTGF